MQKEKTNKPSKKSFLDVVRTLVLEGKLDEDTARLLHDIATESAKVRAALRGMLENWNSVLNAASVIRGDINVVLDNVQDVENYASDDKD